MTNEDRLQQLEADVRELRRQNLTLLRLVLRSGHLSQKLAIDYCEEAVATVFEMQREDFYFYKDRKKQGRQKPENEPNRIAIYTLFNLLHKLFRRPGREIMRHYGYHNFAKWKDIDFDLDLLSFEDIALWAKSVKGVHQLLEEEHTKGELLNAFHIKVLEHLSELLHTSEFFSEVEWLEAIEE